MFVVGALRMSQSDPISTLQLYGLDQVLTDQDDPPLWAAALVKHWPTPNDPNLHVPRLTFGIGMRQDRNTKPAGHDRSGMATIEIWCFQRVDEEHLRAVHTDRETRWSSYPEYILDISRPSAGSEIAFLHAGDNPAPLIGYGETRVWIHQEDGS